MAKLQSTLPNMLLSLTAICLVAGAVLAGVYEVTKDPIEAAKIAELNAAVKAVTPDCDNDASAEAYLAVIDAGESLNN